LRAADSHDFWPPFSFFRVRHFGTIRANDNAGDCRQLQQLKIISGQLVPLVKPVGQRLFLSRNAIQCFSGSSPVGSGIRQRSPSHDVNGKNAALMTREQIIDKIANDRVRLISQFRYDPANQSAAAAVPFQIDRAVRGLTVDFSPPVRTTRALVFSGN
jgi:hypothetical protein